MKAMSKYKLQLLGLWCGLGYLLLLGVGWGLVAGFLLPPISPTKGAGEIAALIANDATRIRIGMVIGMFSALLFIPFAGVVAEYLARVEGGAGMLTYSFLLGSAANMLLSFYPEIWWLVAAFRPDRSPDAIHLMNDLAWLQLLGGVTIYLAMPLSVAVAAFLDESNTPVFPRWSGYANLFLTLLILPDQMIFFFHQGPFAWDGLFGLWLPVTAFAAQFLLMFYVVRQAVKRAVQHTTTATEGRVSVTAACC